jgi:outer membrane protein assembly factor BamB
MKEKYFFPIAAFGVLAACLWIRRPFVEAEVQRKPILSAPIQYSALSGNLPESLFEFRGGGERQGVVINSDRKALHLEFKSLRTNMDVHGASKSSPAVDGSGIYVAGDTGWIRRLDFEGNVLWSFQAQTPGRGFHATPVLSRDTLFIGAYNGWFYALNKESGQPRWAFALGKAIGASALIDGEYVYITVETERDGFVSKHRAKDGQLVWASDFFGEQSHSSVTLDSKNNQLILGTNAKTVVALDRETGKLKWTYRASAEVKGTGALIDGIYVSGAVDAKIFGVDAVTGIERWQIKRRGRIVGNVAVEPKSHLGVISSTDGLFAFDTQTGEKKWDHFYALDSVNPTAQLTFGRQTPLVQRGNSVFEVFAQCRRETVCRFDALSGEKVGELRIGGTYSNVPMFFRDRLFLSFNDAEFEAYRVVAPSASK